MLACRGSIQVGFGGCSWDVQLAPTTHADAEAGLSMPAELLQFRRILKSKAHSFFSLEKTLKSCLLVIGVVGSASAA